MAIGFDESGVIRDLDENFLVWWNSGVGLCLILSALSLTPSPTLIAAPLPLESFLFLLLDSSIHSTISSLSLKTSLYTDLS